MAESQIKYFQWRFDAKKSLDIHFDLIDCGQLQGVADVREFVGLVGIMSGSVMLIYDLFCRMLAHPNAVKWIGDANKETILNEHRHGIAADWDVMKALRIREGLGRENISVVPRDQARMEFAYVASQWAIDFLVLHEIAHIVYGHIDYLYANPIQFTNPEIRQCLEMDADTVAITNTFSKYVLSDDSAWGPMANVGQRMFLWVFSLYGLFRLWGIRVDASNLLGSNHPQTAIRFFTAMGTAELLLNEKPVLKKRFRNIVVSAQRAMGDAIFHLGGPRLLTADIADLTHPKTQEHMEKILASFRSKVVPEMQKHAYISRAGIR